VRIAPVPTGVTGVADATLRVTNGTDTNAAAARRTLNAIGNRHHAAIMSAAVNASVKMIPRDDS
jgi:hypothetical protein